MKKPLVLCILDGCGFREESYGNAFLNAKKPTFDYLWENYPHSLLQASGKAVGLPEGQMGNSEVGHMNIGAGRVVYQPLELINKAIEDKSFFKNNQILEVINHVKENSSKLHIMGLLSDGGVHSHINHLLALMDMIKENDIKEVCYHLFLDGRDVDPKSAYSYIKILEDKIEELGFGKIITISGRYYAMDRDNNYDRLKKAYDAIVYGVGEKYLNPKDLIDKSYEKNVTDEFILPSVVNVGKLEDKDGVITFNFRPDRLRELFTAITNPKESPIDAKVFNNIKVVTMMPVTNTVSCPHAFNHQDLSKTMGKYISNQDLKQLRIAETEKYAHVTYFYDGGVEEDFEGMTKILIPSPKVATYDLKPEMSAEEITDTLLDELNKDYYDVVILNYANGDMVGHTGNYEASVKAIEFLDKCLKRVYDKVTEKQGVLIVTADHGNCDIMLNDGEIVTSHTTMPVPFIVTKKDITLNDGKLADVAPTMLKLLNIKKPKEMTGECLIENKKKNNKIIIGTLIFLIILITIIFSLVFNKPKTIECMKKVDGNGILMNSVVDISRKNNMLKTIEVRKEISIVNDLGKIDYLSVIKSSLDDIYKNQGIKYSIKDEKDKIIVSLTYDKKQEYILDNLFIEVNDEGMSINIISDDSQNNYGKINFSKKYDDKNIIKILEKANYTCD